MTTTMLASLNTALHNAMESNDRVLVLGEDIVDPYGGAFKATRGLSTAFPDRVFTTPISESAITALACGLALRGFRPVAEVMFGDFLFLAADQLINHAAKYRWMYGDKVRVPIVIRAPMGARRGYGPTHSQSLEKHFLGVPGLWVVAPHVLGDPGMILQQAIDQEDPVLLIENKITYSSVLRDAPADFNVVTLSDADSPFPTTWLHPIDGSDGIIFCYGGMVEIVLEALSTLRTEENLFFGLVITTQLSPVPLSHLERIVAESGGNIFAYVEETATNGGWGGEIVATLEDIRLRNGLSAFSHRRIGASNHPIPSSREQEDASLPQVADIVTAVLDCF